MVYLDKLTLAKYTGWTLEYIGKLPARRFTALLNWVNYQRACELYRIEYRLGQVMAILTSDKSHRYKPEHFVGDGPVKPKEVMNMNKPIVPPKVTLGDGNSYQLAILDVNVMEVVEEEFNQSWAELFEKPRAKIIKAVVWYLLRPGYPNLTRDEVGKLLTANVLPELTKAIAGMA